MNENQILNITITILLSIFITIFRDKFSLYFKNKKEVNENY
jgi:hypothetical protein